MDVKEILENYPPFGATKIIKGKLSKEYIFSGIFISGKSVMVLVDIITSISSYEKALGVSGTLFAVRPKIKLNINY